MTDVFQALLGWLIAMIGLWHAHFVSVSPVAAANIAAIFAFVGGIIVAWD